MAAIDDVLERLVIDEGFRRSLAADPAAALAGYDLSADDLRLLASQVSSAAGASGAMEGRTSKAGLFGLLGGLDEIAGAFAPGGDPAAGSGDGTYLLTGVEHSARDVGSGAAGEIAAPSDAGEAAFHKDWIELNSVTQTVTRAAEEPDVADAIAGAAAGPPGEAPAVVGDLNAFDLSDGEPGAAGHEGHIDVESFSPPPPPAAGSGGDGTVDAADYVVWRKTDGVADAESAGLAAPAATDTDTSGGDVVLKGSKIGENAPAPEPTAAGFQKEIDVESFSLGAPTPAASGGSVPVESFSLNFEEVKTTYDPEAPGAATPGGSGGRDLLIGGRTAYEEASAAPAGTVDNDETITIHGNRTEDADVADLNLVRNQFGATPSAAPAAHDTHELEKISLTYQKIELEHGGDASDPGSLAAAPASGAGGVTQYTYDSAGRLDTATGADAAPITAEPEPAAIETLELAHVGFLEDEPADDAEGASPEESG